MKTSSFLTHCTALAVVGALLFAGAGCTGFGRDAADKAAQEQRDREQNDSYLTVAMVLTNSAEVPKDAGPLEFGQEFGCGDRIVYVKVPRQSNTGDIVVDTMATLLAVREAPQPFLYHSLAYSNLAVDRLQSHDGVTTEVLLTGEVSSGGACDDPRIKTQVEATLARLKPKHQVWLNGSEKNWRCLGDQSGQCK